MSLTNEDLIIFVMLPNIARMVSTPFRGVIYMTLGISGEVVFTALKKVLTNVNYESLRLEGQTQLWVAPLYYSGGLFFLERIHNRLRKHYLFIRLSIYATLFLLMEYAAGYFYRKILGKCPWEYEKSPWVLHGYINLKYAPLWALVGYIGEMAHDQIDI